MGKIIAVLLLIALFLRNCGMEPVRPTRSVVIVPENVYNLGSKMSFYDDFDGKLSLNWSILGVDNTHWSLDKVPGSLTITTQNGTYERSATDYKNIFVIDFPAEQSQNFQVTTCVTNFEPKGLWNQAGLILWGDKDNNLKFVYEYGEGPPPNNALKLLFTAATEVKGFANHGWFETEQTPEKMWLRLIKRDGEYELYKSIDGESFIPLTALRPYRLTNDNTIPCLNAPLKSIGIIAMNGTATGAPEVDASFDFFEFQILD